MVNSHSTRESVLKIHSKNKPFCARGGNRTLHVQYRLSLFFTKVLATFSILAQNVRMHIFPELSFNSVESVLGAGIEHYMFSTGCRYFSSVKISGNLFDSQPSHPVYSPYFVLGAGIEPARPCGHKILSLAWLPITPPERRRYFSIKV